MITLPEALTGLLVGYAAGSLMESVLHEYVSDAPGRFTRVWRKHPRLYRILLNTHFSHHIIHHYQTFRKNHVTQFESEQQRTNLERALKARGRHGRTIIAGDFANRLHAEGAVVFAFPACAVGLILAFIAPFPFVLTAAASLALPPLFSYFVHPYLHMSYADGQRRAPPCTAFLLRRKYFKAMYRNHFMHHRYGGTSNYNLVLGADFVRHRLRVPTNDDVAEMRRIGIPVD